MTHCSCPTIDNRDINGMQWVDAGCPLHGDIWDASYEVLRVLRWHGPLQYSQLLARIQDTNERHVHYVLELLVEEGRVAVMIKPGPGPGQLFYHAMDG